MQDYCRHPRCAILGATAILAGAGILCGRAGAIELVAAQLRRPPFDPAGTVEVFVRNDSTRSCRVLDAKMITVPDVEGRGGLPGVEYVRWMPMALASRAVSSPMR